MGRTGGSLPTAAHLDFQLAHALARDAVHDALDLQRPDLGRRLDPGSHDRLVQTSSRATPPDAVFVMADGLSARAVHRHAVPLVSLVRSGLVADGWSLAPVVLAEQGRVALGDEVGALLGARLVVVLIGERPGLSSPDSMGAYLTWDPRVGRTDADRNCISNIRPEGLAYEQAAVRLRYLMSEARRRRLSGVRLKDETGALGE